MFARAAISLVLTVCMLSTLLPCDDEACAADAVLRSSASAGAVLGHDACHDRDAGCAAHNDAAHNAAAQGAAASCGCICHVPALLPHAAQRAAVAATATPPPAVAAVLPFRSLPVPERPPIAA